MQASSASFSNGSSPINLILNHAERRIFDAFLFDAFLFDAFLFDAFLFDDFLRRLKERGFLKGRAVQRTDSLAIIAAIRELDLLELVMETLRLALEAVA